MSTCGECQASVWNSNRPSKIYIKKHQIIITIITIYEVLINVKCTFRLTIVGLNEPSNLIKLAKYEQHAMPPQPSISAIENKEEENGADEKNNNGVQMVEKRSRSLSLSHSRPNGKDVHTKRTRYHAIKHTHELFIISENRHAMNNLKKKKTQKKNVQVHDNNANPFCERGLNFLLIYDD